jgi:hypothetical protein
MNPLNRVAGYVVIAGVFALSACVFSPDRGYGRNDPYRQASGNRHYERDRHCNSNGDYRYHEDRRGNCREFEHHRD